MKRFLVNVVYNSYNYGKQKPVYQYEIHKDSIFEFLNDCCLRHDRLLEKYSLYFVSVKTGDISSSDIIVKSTAIYDDTAISPEVTYKGKTCKAEDFTLENKIRLVKFNYYGGTEYGGERIVKITDEDDRHYIGTDLVKNETRNYLKSKVKNLKELL